MNKTYSKVWNASLGMLVVASEHAKAHGKGGGSKRLRAALAVGLAMVASSSWAAAGVSPCATYYPSPNTPTATGTDALSCGFAANASGNNSIAFGTRARSQGNYSMAMGYQSKALDYSVALGANALSNGDYSTVIGAGDPTFINPDGSTRGNFAGLYGSAMGWAAQSNNRGTTALGSYAHAGNAAFGAGYESYDTAVGYKATGVGDYSTALGSFTHADAAATVAVGGSASASAANAVALGAFSHALGVGSLALGQGSVAGVANSVSFGHSATDLDYLGNPYGSNLNRTLAHVANGVVSTTSTDAVNGSQLYAATTRYVSIHSTGGSNENNDGATGADAIAIGNYATASGDDALASGYSVLASGAKSIAMGFGSVASGYSSVALSSQAMALGANEVSIGVFAGLTSTAVQNAGNTAYGANNHLGQVSLGAGAGQDVAGYSGVYVGGTAGKASVGIQNVAVGDRSGTSGTGDQNTAMGARAGTNVRGSGNVAVGYRAGSYIGTPGGIQTNNTVALGSNAYTNVSDAVALGSGSIAATAAGIAGYVPAGASALQSAAVMTTTSTLGAVSVGDVANNQFRQITGVAAGTANSDAVNVSQLSAVATQASQADALSLKYDDATKARATLAGASGTVLANVAAGTVATDAVNKGQLDALASQAGQADASAVKYDDASRKDQVTLGGANGTRLSNLLASDVASDAATVSQIDDLLSAFGGGAMLQAGGGMVMPTYMIQG
ncbi:MAG: ESPR-type extended signal peptide-containing protein, partial [Burkholderiaceae bacterium]